VSQELDSLVLYTNGAFYRHTSYAQFDAFGCEEQKGQWEMNNGILCLNISGEKENVAIENWKACSGKFKYSIKRRKLVPINDGFGRYAKQQLKLIN
jgi:hypothetical protein